MHVMHITVCDFNQSLYGGAVYLKSESFHLIYYQDVVAISMDL